MARKFYEDDDLDLEFDDDDDDVSWGEMSYNKKFDPWDYSDREDIVSTGMEIYFATATFGDGEDILFQDEEEFENIED